MKPKKKKCKGNYRSGYFKGCGELTYPYKYSLCKSCFMEWCYSTGEGTEYLRKNIIPNAKKDVKQKEKEKDRQLREKLKTLTDYEKEAKSIFQKWVRLRDEGKPCISCGSNSTETDGGHFYKAEIYSGLIFDKRNVHAQCRKCNRFLGGNENNYRLGLISRFGMPYVLQLDADALQLRNHKYTKEELKKIKKKYQLKIKDNDFN